MLAAQYVRMSTERQEYSIMNQIAAIKAYALSHNFEIVKTYSDPGRSGIDLARRPGLRALLEDVVAQEPGFQAILVYDVSRWGRFMDVDESAYYEFLCKKARVRVHYCAEPFSNDESLTSSLLKLIKRTMAAEYLRELSIKVHAGQCRLAAKGFKQGGYAGYGLRRLLLNADGSPKAILQDGQRKSLLSERVTYTLGPEDEVATVRLIFSMFLEQNISIRGIARKLNETHVQRAGRGPWDHNTIYRILTHPKYAGCTVFNRASETLRSKKVRNPREQWVTRPNTFPGIVSCEYFDRVQAKVDIIVNRRSNDKLLLELKALAEREGKLTPRLVCPANGTASASTYVKRFGSLMRAYELIGYEAYRYRSTTLASRRAIGKIRLAIESEFEQVLIESNLPYCRVGHEYQVEGYGCIRLEVARCVKTRNGNLRWLVARGGKFPPDVLLIVRLQEGNNAIRDFASLRTVPDGIAKYFTLSDAAARQCAIVRQYLGEVVDAWKLTANSKLSPKN